MPPLIVTDSAYQFVPPYEGDLWPRFLARFAPRILRKDHGVVRVEIRGGEKLTDLWANGHGVLIAPNHCRMADALVLQALSKELHQPFFFMASSHLFRGSGFLKFVLRRMGAFSVYREGVDRQAVEAAIDMLVDGKRPLVLFPEGALSHANDRLNALMEGVSFIARTAARKVSKLDDQEDRRVYVAPVAIRYLFKGDLEETVNPMLSDIERRLSWRTNEDMPLVDRIYKIGGALLGLKEIEYNGAPESGTIGERLQKLIDVILCPLEAEWLDGRSDTSVVNRVKELRKAIVPAMIGNGDNSESEPLAKPELDRRWRQLEDMELAQALSLYPERYVASAPTVDRILETVERMAENLSGESQAHPPMEAIIQVGDPFPVAAKRDRSAKVDPVLQQLEDSLTAMLQTTSKECRSYSGVGQLTLTPAGDQAESNPYDAPHRTPDVLPPLISRSRQVNVVAAMYVSYAMFMVLRMAPTVAGTSITGNPALGIDLTAWGRILSAGTVGAVFGKFIGGYAADRLGGRVTFTVGLIVSSLGVAAFAASTQLWMFQAAFFVALLAKSAGWPSMAKIIVTSFRPTEYGRVWGILATSSRVGTLIATMCLGGLLSLFSWQAMLSIAGGVGLVISVYFFVAIGARQKSGTDENSPTPSESTPNASHPLNGTSLPQAILHFCRSRQFWLIVSSMMGLTIMWDFLLMVPLYLRDTLNMNPDKAAMASSAFPFGSLISVLVGGYVFDKLNRRSTAWLIGVLLTIAAACILTFFLLPSFNLLEQGALWLSLGLLFVFGLCVAPCYYIPMSVFSIEFGGPHSGFLIALLDALAFGATAVFYYFAGGWAQQSWSLFLMILLGVAVWSMLSTLFFMLGEARKTELAG